MSQNIKEITKKFKHTSKDLPLNHQKRFEGKLQVALHQQKKQFSIFRIAATLVLLVGLGFVFNNLFTSKVEDNYTLGSLSPELERIESYYTNAITYELAKLEITEDNKFILDSYFAKLEELTKTYNKESAQLNIDNINEKSINALIDNLQLRLQLLLQLKQQLKQNFKANTNEKNNI